MTAKFTPQLGTSTGALPFPPSALGFWKHPLKPPRFWGRFLGADDVSDMWIFFYQEMFADWDSPELGFPLSFLSDLLIRADNGNSTVFPSPVIKMKWKFSEQGKKKLCWWSKACLQKMRVGSASAFRKLQVKTSKNMLKWILMDA